MESVLSRRKVPKSSKLIGDSNYAIWSYKIRTALQSEKAWKVVNLDILNNSPIVGDSSSIDSGTSDTSDTREKKDASSSIAAPLSSLASSTELDELRYKAVRIIVAIVKDALVLHIMHKVDPRDV